MLTAGRPTSCPPRSTERTAGRPTPCPRRSTERTAGRPTSCPRDQSKEPRESRHYVHYQTTWRGRRRESASKGLAELAAGGLELRVALAILGDDGGRSARDEALVAELLLEHGQVFFYFGQLAR